MNPDVVTVDDEMSVEALARFLTTNEISGAPVVDAEGVLIGVVSMVDVAKAAAHESASHGDFLRTEPGFDPIEFDDLNTDDSFTVGDILTPSVFTVSEDGSVSDVASTMMRHHLHRVLVVNDDEEVVGIISTSDLLGLLIDAD
jgi:CBS domain-containing protein